MDHGIWRTTQGAWCIVQRWNREAERAICLAPCGLLVGFFSVLNSINRDDALLIIDFIEDAVSARTYSVSFGFRKFLYAHRPWIGGEVFDTLGNSDNLLVRNPVEILLGRGLKNYFVWHVSSDNPPAKYLFLLPPLPLRGRICLLSVQSAPQTPDFSSVIPRPFSEFGLRPYSAGIAIFWLVSFLFVRKTFTDKIKWLAVNFNNTENIQRTRQEGTAPGAKREKRRALPFALDPQNME